MRDGLSLLDQCVAFYLGEKLTYDRVLDVLGAVDTEVFHRILSAVIKGDVRAALGVIDEMIILGRELTWFINEWIWYLRNLLLVCSTDDCEDMIEMSSDNLKLLKEQSEGIAADLLIRYIRVLSELAGKLRYAAQKRVMVEIAIIRLCKPQMEIDYESVKDRVRRLEVMAERGQLAAGVSSDSSIEEVAAPATEKKPSVQKVIYPSALKEDVQMVASNWQEIISSLDAALQTIVKQMTLSVEGEDNAALVLVSSTSSWVDIVTEEKSFQSLRACVNEYAKKEVPINVKCISREEEARGVYPNIEHMINNGVQIEYE